MPLHPCSNAISQTLYSLRLRSVQGQHGFRSSVVRLAQSETTLRPTSLQSASRHRTQSCWVGAQAILTPDCIHPSNGQGLTINTTISNVTEQGYINAPAYLYGDFGASHITPPSKRLRCQRTPAGRLAHPSSHTAELQRKQSTTQCHERLF